MKPQVCLCAAIRSPWLPDLWGVLYSTLAAPLPAGGLDYLVLNHIGATPLQMWDGDVEHTRWLLQVGFLRVGVLWGWRRGAERLGPCGDQAGGSSQEPLASGRAAVVPSGSRKGETKKPVMLCS